MKHKGVRTTFIALALLTLAFSGCFDTSAAPEPMADQSLENDDSETRPVVGSEGPDGLDERPTSPAKADAPSSQQEDQTSEEPSWRYDVLPPVILFMDSGINPYHEDFRLPAGFNGMQDGYYPEEATLLEITLDAESYQDALNTDRAIWDSVERGKLYAFNGTRIVGAIGLDFDCDGDDCRRVLLDDTGHGPLVMSSAAGWTAGTCPDCRIVMSKSLSEMLDTVEMASGWDWIDVISLSAVSVAPIGMGFAKASEQWTTQGRSWINGAGNGPISGGSAALYSEHTRPGNFLVGAWDRDKIQPTYTRLYDVLGAERKDVATHESLDGYRRSGGTSTAAPDVAGHYAWVLWQVRKELGDVDGFKDGVLARASPGFALPPGGPLADGKLTARELEDVIRVTARQVSPVPGAPAGGPLSYLWEGYGLVDNESRDQALRVILDAEEPPERMWEDWWHEMVYHVREGYFEYVMCNGDLFPFSVLPQSDLDPYLTCLQEAHWDPAALPKGPPI